MSAVPTIPPLENGDTLTRAEFERRYNAMPYVKKAELIEGVVYMSSPVRHRAHGHPHGYLLAWLVGYEAATPGVESSDNSTARLDERNEPQADGLLLIDPACGGQTRISSDGYIEGAPELMAEVAASSASIDLNLKLRAYQRNGVREYIVWRPQEQAVDWFALHNSRFVPLVPAADGILRSEVFPGLWLDPAALIRMDVAAVLRILQQGIASPEHAAFVEKLRENAATV